MKIKHRILEFEPEYNLRSICPLDKMLLFDIETTGLKKETTQLYLIGCVYYSGGKWKTTQWLTESTSDEYEILASFLEFADKFDCLVTFNGQGFDIPYINYKADYYMIDSGFSEKESFDIYKHVKKARKLLNLSSMSQKALEEFLGIHRDDKLNGGLLIPVYYDYEKSNSPELEELLLLHNYDDIQGMLKILPVLAYEECMNGRYEFLDIYEQGDRAVIEYRLKTPVPVCVECLQECGKNTEDTDLRLDREILQVIIKIRNETGKLPLENVSDYYYLPDEDTVIHKDVAEFVDRSRRKKATKSNCFLKKQGRFIRQTKPGIMPAFLIGDDRKHTYADLDEMINKNDAELFMKLAGDVLDSYC